MNDDSDFVDLKITIDCISKWLYDRYPLITEYDSKFEIYHLNLILLIQTIISEIVLLESDFFTLHNRTITMIENNQIRLLGDSASIENLLIPLKKFVFDKSGLSLNFSVLKNLIINLPPNFKPYDDCTYGGKKLKFEKLKRELQSGDITEYLFAICKVNSTKGIYYRHSSQPYVLQTMDTKSELNHLKYSEYIITVLNFLI